MSIKVCKFGGTSMADAKAIDNVAKIILSDPTRHYVVVSAPGKRSKEDIKVTDLLYACSENVKSRGECKNTFAKIRTRFKEIVAELKLKVNIDKYLDETEKKIVETNGDSDFAASRGEYLNAVIMASRLGFEFVDASDIIKFNEDGQFDSEYTNDLASKKLSKIKYAVIPGFYGSLPFDKIKTFSRGGSDITGSIIARAVKAELYENWTDVNGFMTADPRIVNNPKPIKQLSYKELRELAYMGASVLHAEAIFPVRSCDIPINIKNTFEPDNCGTLIVPTEKHKPDENHLITGIAGKQDYTIIFIEKSMMNAELGFARKVLSVLERYGISFEHMPSGIDTLSLVIPTCEIEEKLEKVVLRIREAVQPDTINVIEGIALIATVGHGMCKKQGTAAKLCSAIAKAGINLKMIDQGSSELNIIVGVDGSDYENCIKAIYNEMIS